MQGRYRDAPTWFIMMGRQLLALALPLCRDGSLRGESVGLTDLQARLGLLLLLICRLGLLLLLIYSAMSSAKFLMVAQDGDAEGSVRSYTG